MKQLIIGGARSGKSRFAEQVARASAAAGGRVVYLATARVDFPYGSGQRDVEMARRIAHHQASRPADWGLVEVDTGLAAALAAQAAPDVCLLVDCLTLWLSNLFFAGSAARCAEAGEAIDCPLLHGEIAALLDALPGLPGRIVLVSNEVGCSLVPMQALARAFVDEQGRLNQRVAAVCDRVTLISAGLPLVLKA